MNGFVVWGLERRELYSARCPRLQSSWETKVLPSDHAQWSATAATVKISDFALRRFWQMQRVHCVQWVLKTLVQRSANLLGGSPLSNGPNRYNGVNQSIKWGKLVAYGCPLRWCPMKDDDRITSQEATACHKACLGPGVSASVGPLAECNAGQNDLTSSLIHCISSPRQSMITGGRGQLGQMAIAQFDAASLDTVARHYRMSTATYESWEQGQR